MVNTLKTKEQPATELEVSEAGRKRMETALGENEEDYGRLFELFPVGVIILDMKGVIIYCNSTVYEKGGYPEGEFIGKHFSKISSVGVKDIPKYIRVFNSIVRGKTPEPFEATYQRKDGTTGWTEINVGLLKIGGKRRILVIQHDITGHKQAEEALRESEEKFSKAFLASPDSIAITTLKDGKFIEVNESFTRNTGYTREEMIGRSAPHINIWAKAEDRDRILQILKAQGRVSQEEVEFHMKSGEIQVALFSAAPIKIGSEPCLISISNDITERKRAEEALKESEERFRVASQITSDVVYERNLQTGMATFYGDIDTHLGYEPGGYPRTWEGWREHVHPEDLARIESKTIDQMEPSIPYSIEYHMRKKDGTYMTWLDSVMLVLDEKTGKPLKFIGAATDITGHKQAEEALRESEEKFSKAFRSSPDAIAITTLKDGKFIEVNDSYTRITGYTREEVIGHSTAEFGAWAKAEERDRILRMLKEQDRVINEEVHLYKKSGEISVSLFSAELINVDGEPCMISVATDITERKQAEEKLKQALANLEHINTQLAATNKELEAFSYSVSHDLRAPLRSIDGFSQALLEDYLDKLDEQGKDYLSRLRGASQKMGELIDGLLKLSRLIRSDMRKEKVDLSALAEEITTRLQETQPERQAEFVISRGLTANGDRQLLRALLENLLDNAWKFTGKCPQARIEFGAAQSGDKKTYFVRDNGAGFDMTYADKLFSAFQRLHETTEFPGTGIGLATVQRIINRHGGSVWAEGAVGKGATFYFTLN